MKTIITLLVGLIAPFLAQADIFPYPEKTLKVMVICGVGANCDQGLTAMFAASAYLDKAVNVKLSLVGPILHTSQQMEGDDSQRMAKWQAYVKDRRLTYKPDLVLVLLPALPFGPINFMEEQVYGRASGIGELKNPDALVYLRVIGSDDFMTNLIAHEVGHILGATHTDGYGIMAADVGQVQYMRSYCAETIEQIEEYLATISP